MRLEKRGEGFVPSPALDAAARYVVAGLNPIPIKPQDKRPATSTWKALQYAPMIESHSADDLDRYLSSWWERGERGVAVLTGAPFGLVVVDVDSPRARNLIESACGCWPETTEVETAKGCHLWFAHPGGVISNRARVADVELDVRGDGGYVVAPPSVHPSGHVYCFANRVEPLPALPAPLLRLIRPLRAAKPAQPQRTHGAGRGYAAAALDDEIHTVRTSSEGARNDTLNTAAFNLARFVVSGELGASQVASELTVAAIAAGLSEAEARRTIASAFEARAA